MGPLGSTLGGDPALPSSTPKGNGPARSRGSGEPHRHQPPPPNREGGSPTDSAFSTPDPASRDPPHPAPLSPPASRRRLPGPPLFGGGAALDPSSPASAREQKRRRGRGTRGTSAAEVLRVGDLQFRVSPRSASVPSPPPGVGRRGVPPRARWPGFASPSRSDSAALGAAGSRRAAAGGLGRAEGRAPLCVSSLVVLA